MEGLRSICLRAAVVFPCFVASLTANLTSEQRKAHLDSFDHVWNTVQRTYWDPAYLAGEKPGSVNWKAVHKELRPEMEKVQSRDEARAVLSRMLARLKQSHFGIIPLEVYKDIDTKPGKKSADRPQSGAPEPAMEGDGESGVDLRVINGHALVTSVDPASPAAKAGVKTGWRIVKIDGEDVEAVIGRVRTMTQLRDLVLNRAIAARMNVDAGSRVKVEFLDANDHPVTLELLATRPRGNPARFGHLPPQWVWFESRRVETNVGYIRFNLFMDPARLMAGFEDAVKSFASSPGIVIDLRGNPGGIGIMAMGMAGWFIDKPDQQLGTMYMMQSPLKFFVNPRLPGYRSKVAILIDGGSASTSEIFAGGMKDLGRARIFGTRSAGAALPSVIEKLPNGDGFQYAPANYISDGGKVLEGDGVIPDVEVNHTRELLLQGRDAALEAAIHWIKR